MYRGGGNEATVNSLVGSRFCGGYSWRHDSALFVRLDRAEYSGLATFGDQRVHMGAYEAAVLAAVSLCVHSVAVFQGARELLVC